MRERESIDFAAPANLDPLGARRHAVRAERARVEAEVAAISAFLDIEFVTLGGFPPRAHLFIDMRERFRVTLFFFFVSHLFRQPSWSLNTCRHSLVAQDQRRAGMPRAQFAAGAMAERDRAILDLARAAFATQLLD